MCCTLAMSVTYPGAAYRCAQVATGITSSQLMACDKEENFWSMGSTGPCGPCTEIFWQQDQYDAGSEDRWLEIWNLVFMQYERAEDGELSQLPQPSVDTGALIRVTAHAKACTQN